MGIKFTNFLRRVVLKLEADSGHCGPVGHCVGNVNVLKPFKLK
jgi:hypothetical protein